MKSNRSFAFRGGLQSNETTRTQIFAQITIMPTLTILDSVINFIALLATFKTPATTTSFPCSQPSSGLKSKPLSEPPGALSCFCVAESRASRGVCGSLVCRKP